MTAVRSTRRARSRVIVPLVLIVFLGALAVSALVIGNPAKSRGLLTTTSLRAGSYHPSKDLPPSHDNDAGRARAPDATPDADTDAWQRG